VGDSPAARQAGFQPASNTVRIAAVTDVHDPNLGIFWEQPQELPVYTTPAQATILRPLPLPHPCIDPPRRSPAVSRSPHVGILRLLLPHARRP
jgi:hypothetical protein